MDTAKVYHDSDGNECTIHQMVKREPHWTASRFQWMEAEIERLQGRLKLLDALEGAGVDNWDGYDVAVEMMD